ncbi:hypothetical protein D3C87_1333370 [compost metagenome]
MQQESYNFTKEEGDATYEFVSAGPKGKIRKTIIYQQIPGRTNTYNLAFGDLDEKNRTINDLTTSNNSDTQKVLVTVAKTLLDFMNNRLNAIVFATGSTPSRTRLYQMGISQFYDEIHLKFNVKGYYNHSWQPFERGRNYQAFLLKHK